MKKLIVLLMLLPLLSFAQDVKQEIKPNHPKNEIGLNAGVIFFTDKKLSGRSPSAKFGAAYFRNFKQTQVGLVIDYNKDDWAFNCLTPTIVLNRKFNFGKSYLYTGGAAGYFYALAHDANIKLNGYTVGLQAGYVLALGKHFALSTEVAVRSTQYYFKMHSLPANYTSGYLTDFSLSFPATIGIRYRFK